MCLSPLDLHSAAVSDSQLPCHAHTMLWPCRFSQGYRTTRPSRDELWTTCPRSAFSGYHAGFHEGCYQKIPILDAGGQRETKQHLSWTRKRVVAAHCKKDDQWNCWTSNSDISGYHADVHEVHDTVGEWQRCGMLSFFKLLQFRLLLSHFSCTSS